MNRKILLTAALSLMVAASCNKIEDAPAPSGDMPLRFSPSTCVVTKSAIDGTMFPDSGTFILSACYSSGASKANYFSGVTFAKKGSLWSADKYWPTTGSLDFLALSCDSLGTVTLVYADKCSDSLTVAIPDNSTVQSDILHASAQGQTYSASGTTLSFNHAQALVIFTAGSTVPYDASANKGVTIKSIALKNACFSGTLKVRAVSASGDYCAWSLLGTKVTADSLRNASGSAALNYNVPETPMDITVAGNHMGIGGRGIMVPEQAQTSFEVAYTLHNGKDGSGNPLNTDLAYTYTCTGNWTEGKKHNYKINFNLNGITVNPTVTDWSTVEEDVPVPEPVAATYAVSGATSVTLPTGVMAANSVISVNWGDGNAEAFTNMMKTSDAANDTLRLSHTYSSTFTGKMKLNARKGSLDFGTVDATTYNKFIIFSDSKIKVKTVTPVSGLYVNCFVVDPSKSFSFTPENVDVFWGDKGYENVPANVIGTSGAWTAEMLWTDFDASKMTLTKASGTGIKDVCTVSFTDATVRGNAVIVIKKGLTVVWSYHLWITDYDPVTNAVIFSGDSYSWMSRNVGAMTDAYEEAHCLMYQFGRKDPFPYDKVISGTAVTVVDKDSTGTSNYNNIPYSVGNPSVFIKDIYSKYWTFNDIYNPSTYDDSIRWQDPTTKTGGSRTGEKSLFDPCPEGWRMPTKEEFTALVNKGRAYDSSDRGSYVPSKTASPHLFIPSSGFLNQYGSSTYRGSGGCCWSMSPKSRYNGTNLYDLNPDFMVSSDCRSRGFSVRCVSDN